MNWSVCSICKIDGLFLIELAVQYQIQLLCAGKQQGQTAVKAILEPQLISRGIMHALEVTICFFEMRADVKISTNVIRSFLPASGTQDEQNGQEKNC